MEQTDKFLEGFVFTDEISDLDILEDIDSFKRSEKDGGVVSCSWDLKKEGLLVSH